MARFLAKNVFENIFFCSLNNFPGFRAKFRVFFAEFVKNVDKL
jgi:hypothetical protein